MFQMNIKLLECRAIPSVMWSCQNEKASENQMYVADTVIKMEPPGLRHDCYFGEDTHSFLYCTQMSNSGRNENKHMSCITLLDGWLAKPQLPPPQDLYSSLQGSSQVRVVWFDTSLDIRVIQRKTSSAEY